MRRGINSALFIGVLMSIFCLTPVTWGRQWQISEIGTAGDFLSLKLDASDNPRIAYRTRNGSVDTLTYTYFDGSSWRAQTVDNSGHAGAYCSLALDTMGYAHISYFDGAGEDLKYAYWNGSSWNTQTLDSQGSVGGFTSIALDKNNKSHISYIDWGAGSVGYAHEDSSGWVIDEISALYGRTSIALDSSGNPHIAADNQYASWDGMSWTTMTFNNGAINSDVSLALDSSDNPHIAYHDIESDILKYASWNGSNGSSWNNQIVAGLDNGGELDMVLGNDVLPDIAYTRYGGIKYASFNGSSWDIEGVAGGSSVSIELDSKGLVHMVYTDWGKGKLMYAEEVPEPATLLLLALGGFALRKKR